MSKTKKAPGATGAGGSVAEATQRDHPDDTTNLPKTQEPSSNGRDGPALALSPALSEHLNDCRRQADLWVMSCVQGWEDDITHDTLDKLRNQYELLPPKGQDAVIDYIGSKLDIVRNRAKAEADLGRVLGIEPILKAERGPVDILACLDENEAGDAALFAQLYHGTVCHDHSDGRWYVWAGHNWRLDDCKAMTDLVSGPLAAAYLEEAARQSATGETGKSAELAKRAGALRYRSRINNVLVLASSKSTLALSGKEWDRDPWLLGCANGVLNLKTGDFRAGKPGDYIRAVCPTAWEGLEAPAPRWEKFLDEVFNKDAELIAFVKRLLGYGLTGLAVEHVLPIAWGMGRNGKDTLFSTLSHVLGREIAGPTDSGVLMDRVTNPEAPTPARYGLRFKRLVWCAETNEGQRLNPGTVKMLTGGGQFQARTLHGRPIVITPGYLPILMTNYKPHAPADDDALWDRLQLIPFTQRFVDDPKEENEHKRDAHLVEKLIGEAPGILASLVLACLDWQTHGLKPPEIVKVATEEYRKDEDELSQFFEECCLLRTDIEVKSNDLYQHYAEWAARRGVKPMSHTALGLRMKKRGFDKRLSGGVWYQGIGLLSG